MQGPREFVFYTGRPADCRRAITPLAPYTLRTMPSGVANVEAILAQISSARLLGSLSDRKLCRIHWTFLPENQLDRFLGLLFWVRCRSRRRNWPSVRQIGGAELCRMNVKRLTLGLMSWRMPSLLCQRIAINHPLSMLSEYGPF